ncbi:hypothetical protein MNBD_ALPHA11-1451, partial [hydrothermal vent metagenome]
SPQLLEPLTELLSACFDKAALAIAHHSDSTQANPAQQYKDAIRLLLERFR